MKTLLIGSTLLLTLIANGQANTTCNITLYNKTAGAKTSYTLEGESISQKVIAKLSTQCTFSIKTMSVAQKKAMTVKSLKKRLAKLTNK